MGRQGRQFLTWKVLQDLFVNEKGLEEREDDEAGEDIISEAMY